MLQGLSLSHCLRHTGTCQSHYYSDRLFIQLNAYFVVELNFRFQLNFVLIVVEANDKYYARIKVPKTLCERIEKALGK